MSELLKIASAAYEQHKLEKTAFLESLVSPETLHTLTGVAKHVGLGTLAHVGSNAAIKAFRSAKSNRVMQSLGELGVKHGLEGKQVHPFLMDRITQLVGPEALAEYTGAKSLVRRGLSKSQDVSGKFLINENIPKVVNAGNLKKLMQRRNGVNPMQVGIAGVEGAVKRKLGLKPSTDVSDYPILGNVVRSTKSFVANEGKLTEHKGIGGRLINAGTKLLDRLSTSSTNTSGLANRKVRDAANAGFTVASMAVPGLGDHIAINTLRDTATRLPAGHGLLKGRIMTGFNSEEPVKLFGKFGPKVVEGKGFLGKARRAVGDYLYSPTAFGEARDFGAKARKDGFTDRTLTKVLPILGKFS